MPTPFSRTHDLGRVFDAGSLNRDLVLIGSAEKVQPKDETIAADAVVEDRMVALASMARRRRQ